MLMFVEVKTRREDIAEELSEAARLPQWERIARSARTFLSHPAARGRPFRFDLVTVLWGADSDPIVEHLTDVFQPRWR